MSNIPYSNIDWTNMANNKVKLLIIDGDFLI
jgi:hypothetical protein